MIRDIARDGDRRLRVTFNEDWERVADQLEDVLTPGSSGVVALVEDEAVVEIQKALAQAEEIVTKAVDKQVAAEIDREAANAKESLGV